MKLSLDPESIAGISQRLAEANARFARLYPG
jgi:hypothetical protein